MMWEVVTYFLAFTDSLLALNSAFALLHSLLFTYELLHHKDDLHKKSI